MQALCFSAKRTNRRTLFSEARELSTEPPIRKLPPSSSTRNCFDVRLPDAQRDQPVIAGFSGGNSYSSIRNLEFTPGFCTYSPDSNLTLRMPYAAH